MFDKLEQQGGAGLFVAVDGSHEQAHVRSGAEEQVIDGAVFDGMAEKKLAG